MPFFTSAFMIGIALWVIASVPLAIPHGPGQSIESMTAFVVARDASFPVWLGAFACLLAALALRAWRSLEARYRPPVSTHSSTRRSGGHVVWAYLTIVIRSGGTERAGSRICWRHVRRRGVGDEDSFANSANRAE